MRLSRNEVGEKGVGVLLALVLALWVPGGSVARAADERGSAPATADTQAGTQQVTVVDPDTGQPAPLKDVAASKLAELPPGELRCVVLEADAATPHAGAEVVVNAESGKQIATAVTGEDGVCTFADVPEGTYLVSVRGTSCAVGLVVKEGGEPGQLNIVLPRAARSPFPAWAPEGMHSHPTLATAVLTAAGTLFVVAPVAYYVGEKHERGKVYISPTTP